MDHTKTAAGSRMFRHMLAHPLRSKDAIEQRLDAVSYLKDMTDEVTQFDCPLVSMSSLTWCDVWIFFLRAVNSCTTFVSTTHARISP